MSENQVDETMVEQNGSDAVVDPTPALPAEEALEGIAEADGYQFDFTKIHGTDVKEFYTQVSRARTVTSFAAILPSVVNLEKDWSSNPGEAPFVLVRAVNKAFQKAARTFEIEACDDVRFKVEDVIAQDVDNWMVVAFVSNAAAMAEIMDKYAVARKKGYEDLLELDFATFLSVASRFNDALLDLSKN